MLFTLGHSNRSFEEFSEIIQKFSISIILDIRSIPYSRWNPHFGKKYLEGKFSGTGIQYHYKGDVLGGKYSDPEYIIRPGIADYGKVMNRPEFRHEMDSWVPRFLSDKENLCFFCCEKDPLYCHRNLLINRYLFPVIPEIINIIDLGTFLSQEKLETMMVDIYREKMGADLFYEPPGREAIFRYFNERKR